MPMPETSQESRVFCDGGVLIPSRADLCNGRPPSRTRFGEPGPPRRTPQYPQSVFAFMNRALLPHVVFWALMVAGWYLSQLSNRQIGVFVGLWLGSILLIPLLPSGGLWMTAIVAVMDIVLILLVFKRDIRI